MYQCNFRVFGRFRNSIAEATGAIAFWRWPFSNRDSVATVLAVHLPGGESTTLFDTITTKLKVAA